MKQRMVMRPASVLLSSFFRNMAKASRSFSLLYGSMPAPLRTLTETPASLPVFTSLQTVGIQTLTAPW